MRRKLSSDTARQTFRQFAWNLAGTLAGTKAGQAGPATAGGKR